MKKAIATVLGFALLFCAGVSVAEQARQTDDNISITKTSTYIILSWSENSTRVDYYFMRENPSATGRLRIFEGDDVLMIWFAHGSNNVISYYDHQANRVRACDETSTVTCQEISEIVAAWRAFLDADRRINQVLETQPQRFMPPAQ